MSSKKDAIMGAIGTTLYCITFVALFAMPIVLLWRNAPSDEWFDVMVPIVLAFCLLSYMGKYYTLQAELEALKKTRAPSEPEDTPSSSEDS